MEKQHDYLLFNKASPCLKKGVGSYERTADGLLLIAPQGDLGV
ncbi:hypothetical protein [Yersinia intermedia]|nr:hypothetical protein [Yersinia intermedia]